MPITLSGSSICIFTHHYHPQLSGIGNFVDGLAHALAARGDRVVIVTNDSMRVGVGHSVENGLEIIRLPCISLLDGRLPLPKKTGDYYRLLQSLDDYEWDGVLINTNILFRKCHCFATEYGGIDIAECHKSHAGDVLIGSNVPTAKAV